jgi:hypothetical protein
VAELTAEEQSAVACRCHAGICPLHNGESDGYVEHQASDLVAVVERILTDREAAAERRGAVNALREAAEAVHTDPKWIETFSRSLAPYLRKKFADWLRARADRIETSDA